MLKQTVFFKHRSLFELAFLPTPFKEHLTSPTRIQP